MWLAKLPIVERKLRIDSAKNGAAPGSRKATWGVRLGVAGLGLDLTALRSLVPLVEGVALRMAGNMVGHVREPLLIRSELFALAEIADAAFETKLSEWELRGRLHTAVSLRINGRTAPTAQADGEPSHVFTAVASIDVVDLPRSGRCFFGATLPSLSVSGPSLRWSRAGSPKRLTIPGMVR